MNTKSKKVILYVEDEELLRKLVRHSFKGRDYEIVEAEDGAEALKKAEQLHPDIILMDLQLPKISGYDAIVAIKQNPALKKIPIIALTGFALAGEEQKALDAGCDHYITKPFDPLTLMEIVDGYLAG